MDIFSRGLVESPARERYTESECRTCAACCHHPDPRWVRIDPETDKIPEDLIEVTKGQALQFMRHEKGRCAALTDNGKGFFTCSIYETRPQVCRDFEIDGPFCEPERSRKLVQIRRKLEPVEDLK